jgi:hypothetical protein
MDTEHSNQDMPGAQSSCPAPEYREDVLACTRQCLALYSLADEVHVAGRALAFCEPAQMKTCRDSQAKHNLSTICVIVASVSAKVFHELPRLDPPHMCASELFKHICSSLRRS